ncbi:MAG: nucleotidyltransferase family protein [Pseudomonadota bacterium]
MSSIISHAMIFAAGLGSRMRPLTDHTPKPLLKAGGRCLIDYHVDRFLDLGINNIVINVSHLGKQVIQHIKSNYSNHPTIHFSIEEIPQETAGGLRLAYDRGLFGNSSENTVLVINADIWIDGDFIPLITYYKQLPVNSVLLAMVANPIQHPKGDFCLASDGTLHTVPLEDAVSTGTLTFSGIGFYPLSFIQEITPGISPLSKWLRGGMQKKQVYGYEWQYAWSDIGTPERLNELDTQLSKK